MCGRRWCAGSAGRATSRRPCSPSGASSARLRPRRTSTSDRHHVRHGVEGELVDAVAPGLQRRATGPGRRRTGRRPPTLSGCQAAKITRATAMKPRPCGHVLEPGVGVGGRQLGAADAGEHAADDHGEVAHPQGRVAVGGERPRSARRRPAAAGPTGCGRSATTWPGRPRSTTGRQRVVVEEDVAEPRDAPTARDWRGREGVDRSRPRTTRRTATSAPGRGTARRGPVASWLAPRCTTRTACTSASSPPAAAPASTPTHGLPVSAVTA